MRIVPIITLTFLINISYVFSQSKPISNNNSESYVDKLTRKGLLLYERDIDSTFYYTLQAKEIADSIGYVKGKADIANNMGIFFDIKGNLQLALRYYNSGYTIYKELKDTSNMIQAMMNIAMVYKEMGKNERGIKQFDTALKLGHNLKRDSIMSLLIYNYALVYPKAFKGDSLNLYINKAKDIAQRYKDKKTLLAVDQLIADHLISTGNKQKGLALLDSTINRTLNEHLYYVSMDMLIDMGNQLVEQDTSRALGYYKKALQIAQDNGFLIYSSEVAKLLFDFHKKRKNDSVAVYYAGLLRRFQEDREKLDRDSEIDYLDYVVKEKKFDSLLVKSKYQTALLSVAVITILLALIFIFVVVKNLKKTKILNRQILLQNESMNEALNALEISQEENTRLVKMAVHDLRNPISGIFSLADIMIKKGVNDPLDLKKLSLIRDSSERSLSIVSEMLQLPNEQIAKKPVDLKEMLQYCVQILKGKAEEKKQHIILEAEQVTIVASREKLWRVVSNLISNSIKFSNNGGQIQVVLSQSPSGALIMVKDNGVGISESMKKNIFEPVTGIMGTAGERSFGFGLVISKQIVEAHNGRIWFESPPTGGCEFYVELPMV